MPESAKPTNSKYQVVPYNPAWPQDYTNAARQLKKILKDILIEIHHVGSTAVPNLSAKDLIDILIVVKDIHTVDGYNEALYTLGYDSRGEREIVGRRYFVKKRRGLHTHHLHIYQADHPEVKNLILFRDFLIAHPEKAKAYESLKLALSKKYVNDGDAYRAGKDQFIKDLLVEAKQWMGLEL